MAYEKAYRKICGSTKNAQTNKKVLSYCFFYRPLYHRVFIITLYAMHRSVQLFLLML